MDYATLGKKPVEGDQPAGIDARYQPTFEKLQAEIDKLGSPTASGQVDWGGIVKSSAQILTSLSKDLTVASYMAVGLVHTSQIHGLDQGVQVIRDLLETYWDQLYPPRKRMRGRVGALTWWLEKTEIALQKLSFDKPLPADLVGRIIDNLKAIDQLLTEKMPDPPLASAVQRIVERYALEQREPPAAEPSDRSPQKDPTPVASAVPDPSPVQPDPVTTAPQPRQPLLKPPMEAEIAHHLTNSQEAGRAVDQALQRIRQASGVLLTSDLQDPLAYRLRRMAAWARVEVLPPYSDSTTRIPPPPAQVQESLQQMRAADNLPALIETAEQKLSQFVFWFDLNRMVAEALQDLGAGYHGALAAVQQETAGFAGRLPGVEGLRFAGGLPFADEATCQWLKGLSESIKTAPSAVAGTGPDAAAEQIQAVLQEAKAMARGKRLVEGVDLLQTHMRRNPSRCNQMRWRMAIIEILLSAKKIQQVLPHAAQVLQDVEDFRLEDWDPELALESLQIAWQALNAQNTNEHRERAGQVLQRIARINPAAALRMLP